IVRQQESAQTGQIFREEHRDQPPPLYISSCIPSDVHLLRLLSALHTASPRSVINSQLLRWPVQRPWRAPGRQEENQETAPCLATAPAGWSCPAPSTTGPALYMSYPVPCPQPEGQDEPQTNQQLPWSSSSSSTPPSPLCHRSEERASVFSGEQSGSLSPCHSVSLSNRPLHQQRPPPYLPPAYPAQTPTAANRIEDVSKSAVFKLPWQQASTRSEREPQEASSRQGPLPDLLPQNEQLSWASPPRHGAPGGEAVQVQVIRRVAHQLRAMGDEINATVLHRAGAVPLWQDWRDVCRGFFHFLTQTLSTLYRIT
ncbi:hypothetical protein KUCAC02_005937, partial [Chaenocephalus aceratus]